MAFDSERFIVEVENRPCLWNTASKEYSDRNLKIKSWNELVNLFKEKDDMTNQERKELAKKKYTRWCFVPLCKNTEIRTPEKVFVSVPRCEKLRTKWFLAANRVIAASKSCFYCCEDHFDLPNDMENYLRWTIMKGPIKLKEGVVPHIFDCQPDRSTTESSKPRPLIKKMQKKRLTEEIPGPIEENKIDDSKVLGADDQGLGYGPWTSKPSTLISSGTSSPNYHDVEENLRKRRDFEQELSSHSLDSPEYIEIPMEEIKIEETQVLIEDDLGLDHGPSAASQKSTLTSPLISSLYNFDLEEKLKSIKEEVVECMEDLPIDPIELNPACSSIIPLKLNKRKRSNSSDKPASASLFEDSLNIAEDEDAFDLTGKIIATKLRRFPEKIRIIAKTLFNDILYLAELGNLNENSVIISNHC